MSIIRTNRRENPYAQMDKTPLNDPTLSFKAKGILAYLFSKPDDWVLRVADLVKKAKDGEESVLAGLKELRATGYLMRSTIRERGRFVGYAYDIFERPVFAPEPQNPAAVAPEPQKPEPGKPGPEKPEPENTPLTNNKGLVSNDNSKNNLTKAPGYSFEDFWAAYNKKVDQVAAIKAWAKLKPSDLEAIKIHVPKYVAANPEKQYRKNPATYLNGRGWENEIIPRQSIDGALSNLAPHILPSRPGKMVLPAKI